MARSVACVRGGVGATHCCIKRCIIIMHEPSLGPHWGTTSAKITVCDTTSQWANLDPPYQMLVTMMLMTMRIQCANYQGALRDCDDHVKMNLGIISRALIKMDQALNISVLCHTFILRPSQKAQASV